jgi:hypothetical protein
MRLDPKDATTSDIHVETFVCDRELHIIIFSTYQHVFMKMGQPRNGIIKMSRLYMRRCGFYLGSSI